MPANESDTKEGEYSTSNQQKNEPMETSTDDYKRLLDDDEGDAELLDLDF